MISDIVIGVIIALVAAVIVIFLILLAINALLVFKLRSIIPPSPSATLSAALHSRARRQERRAMTTRNRPEHKA